MACLAEPPVISGTRSWKGGGESARSQASPASGFKAGENPRTQGDSAQGSQCPNGSGSTPGIQVSPGTPQPLFLACFMALRA
jgi:hypothetical protein